MVYASKQFVRLGVLAACAAALMGCQSVRDAAGLGKQSPDEFAVATKQPLIIPPEFNLRPPRDGAPPTNQVDPMTGARNDLYPDDPQEAAKHISGDYSEAERQLLASARATNPDPAIRQRIAADGKAMEASDDSFTSDVLFWQDNKDHGTNVDADAESRRIEAQKAAGAGASTKPAAQKPNDSATIGKDDKQDSKGGWLDGIF
jgi:hypothetical protein